MNAAVRIFKEIPLHALILPSIFTAQIFSTNQYRLEISESVAALLFLVVVAAVLTVLMTVLMGGFRKGGVATTCILFLALYFPALTSSVATEAIYQHYILLVGIAVTAGLLLLIRTAQGDFVSLTIMLNAALFVAAVPAVTPIVMFQLGPALQRPAPSQLYSDLPALSPVHDRDVWHLVFDRYGNKETLKRVYDVDNEAFYQALEARGFVVARSSTANYQRTAHSLASIYNLDYLEPLTEFVGEESQDWVPLYRLLTDNRISRFFAEIGYHHVHLGSWWNPTRINSYADENRNLRDMPELVRTILNISVIGRLASVFGWGPAHARGDQCSRIKFKFDQLQELASVPGGKFVTAHVLLPHPPYVVDVQGECMDLETAQSRTREENYRGQLLYANRRILELIDTILTNASVRPIIILQSDEGPWPERFAGDEDVVGRDAPPTDWTRLTTEELREKMGVLNALYLPGMDYNGLPDSATLVNTFRLIFNYYFSGKLKLLPEKNFIYEDGRHLYKFRQVTERLRQQN